MRNKLPSSRALLLLACALFVVCVYMCVDLIRAVLYQCLCSSVGSGGECWWRWWRSVDGKDRHWSPVCTILFACSSLAAVAGSWLLNAWRLAFIGAHFQEQSVSDSHSLSFCPILVHFALRVKGDRDTNSWYIHWWAFCIIESQHTQTHCRPVQTYQHLSSLAPTSHFAAPASVLSEVLSLACN